MVIAFSSVVRIHSSFKSSVCEKYLHCFMARRGDIGSDYTISSTTVKASDRNSEQEPSTHVRASQDCGSVLGRVQSSRWVEESVGDPLLRPTWKLLELLVFAEARIQGYKAERATLIQVSVGIVE